MPSTVFDASGLAIVAYVQVDHVGTGVYNITLPGDNSVQGNLPLQQGQGNENSGPNWRQDLVIVTPTRSAHGPLMISTNDVTGFIKQVYLATSAAPSDSDFAIVIFRSAIPTPTDSNGNQDSPV